MPSLDIDDCSTCPFAWKYIPENMHKCSREETFDLPSFPVVPSNCPLL